MSAILLEVLGISSVLGTALAIVRVRRPGFASFPIMMIGWLVGEFPLFHIAAQAVAAATLVAVGGFGDTAGHIGLGLLAVSWAGLWHVRSVSMLAGRSAEKALRDGLGAGYRERLDAARVERFRSGADTRPTRRPVHNDAAGIGIVRDVAYGEDPRRNVCDLYLPDGGPDLAEPGRLAPVVLQIHGGAWITGNKEQQGQPLLHRLAQVGIVGVSINYRLGPTHRFPEPIIDVKRAIAWTKEHIADHGGDPDRIVLTGGSAGGHLAALAALTPNLAAFQPGFADSDTTVAACVPFYGPTDLTDRSGVRSRSTSLESFLTARVMPGPLAGDPALWELMSPISHVRPDAPPFFVIQGANDVLVWREEQRLFVDALRAVSDAPVVSWEVPGAQHAFDTFNSRRSAASVDAVERFVAWVDATAPERSVHGGETQR
jgi:acetyl esterase/lipase